MIKLTKLEEPSELKIARERFLDKYLECFEFSDEKYKKKIEISSSLKNKYNIANVKRTLESETHGKCAYCESKVRHITYGDIEHILPKVHRPDLVFEWTNLTIACPQCNRIRKNDYYSVNEPLINPYTEDPGEFLFACGPMIMPKPANDKGFITQQLLELNRAELHERRKEKIELIHYLIESWAQANGPRKAVLKKTLLKYIEPSKEFSFVLKGYFKACGLI
ncbi:HNH endonuclease [Priestia megaterium]|uniref:HNH endonuclease n=1 Tax=Priestia megaterium TaxID=1404 RepID=UPI001CD81547|nr:HNH endonuclease [Priestia megaterium]